MRGCGGTVGPRCGPQGLKVRFPAGHRAAFLAAGDVPSAVESFTVRTKGEVHVVDLTEEVRRRVRASGVQEGLACVFVAGSTAAITTLEFEPGLAEEDLPQALERLFPRHGQGLDYGHERAWHDGNGHSHVRAAFLGPSLTVPVSDGAPVLGTWQQVVLVELDTKPRERRVVVQIVGM